MIVTMATVVKAEPTEDVRELRWRYDIRMKFSDYGALLHELSPDEDWANECQIEFDWHEKLVRFRFFHDAVEDKCIIVCVLMDDPDDVIFERFTQAQEMMEKEINDRIEAD